MCRPEGDMPGENLADPPGAGEADLQAYRRAAAGNGYRRSSAGEKIRTAADASSDPGRVAGCPDVGETTVIRRDRTARRHMAPYRSQCRENYVALSRASSDGARCTTLATGYHHH